MDFKSSFFFPKTFAQMRISRFEGFLFFCHTQDMQKVLIEPVPQQQPEPQE